MKQLCAFMGELEFYFKVAFFCAIIQQVFYFILQNIELNFIAEVALYWLVGSISFYSIGFLIEKVIKRNAALKVKLTVRVQPIREQVFPTFTAQGILFGEVKAFISAFIVLFLAPEVHRGNNFLLNFAWFLMQIAVADFLFYIAHYSLHKNRFLRKQHLKHHEFQDTSSFVAGHKTLFEYIMVTFCDLLPVFIFGYDITQLCAWTIVGNAYNLEGHSSLSLFFVPSDFHDLHHTSFQGNYGIQGLWDKFFGTLNPSVRRQGILFPVSFLEKKFMN
ncbi:MAG: sterol desaturase family protein [Leptolyngbyaceae cyanobacterium]